jgi:hypothetical protein
MKIITRLLCALVVCWGVAALATLPDPVRRTQAFPMNDVVDIQYQVTESFGNRAESVSLDIKQMGRYSLGVIPTLEETLAVLPSGMFRHALERASPSDGMIAWLGDREIRNVGLPLRCWTSEGEPLLSRFLGPPSLSWHGGLPIGTHTLPIRPLPLPLAVNLLFWYAVIYSVELSFVNLRGRRRGRQGLCRKCAYPRPDGAIRCPECGMTLPISAALPPPP